MQPVTFALSPFEGSIVRDVQPIGRTLQEIVENVPGLNLALPLVVAVDGAVIPREFWPRMRPKLKRDGEWPQVTIHMALHGGGSGGNAVKSILQLVATVALIALSAGTASFLTPLIGATFAKTAAAGVLIAGSLALKALAPPPAKEARAATSANGGAKDPGVAFAEGNILELGAVIPRVAGTIRIFPPLVAQPLVELVGTDEIVEAIYALQGPHDLSDIRVENTVASSLPELTIETRQGFISDAQIGLIDRFGVTQAPNALLGGHVTFPDQETILDSSLAIEQVTPRWSQYESKKDPDQIWLDLFWNEGLVNSTALDTDIGQPVRVRMRPRGTTTWLNLPEVHFNSREVQVYRKSIRLIWAASVPTLPTPPTREGPYVAIHSAPVQEKAPFTGAYDAEASFVGGASRTQVLRTALYQDRVEFYLDPAVFNRGLVWQVEVIRGMAYAVASFNTSTYAYAGTVRDLFGWFTGGTSQPTIAYSRNGLSDKVTVARFVSVFNRPPIGKQSGLALIAVKAKNRSIARVSVLASGLVPDWDGTSWAGNVITRNPAAHLRSVMTDPLLNSKPIPDRIIDNAGLVTWRTACIAAGYTCDMVLDGRTVWDTLSAIAACGYARPRAGDFWGVARDYNRSAEAPSVLFSPLNVRNVEFSKSFERRPDAFRVRYRSSADDYSDREIVVSDPVRGNITPGLVETMTYEGIVEESKATARALFDFKQMRLRATEVSFETAAEGVIVRKGDLVGFQHDMLSSSVAASRIEQVLTSGGNVTGLVLETAVPITNKPSLWDVTSLWAETDLWAIGQKTGVAIQLSNEDSLVKTISNADGSTKTLTFTTPFAIPAGLEPEMQIVVGPVGREVRRMVVTGVQPNSNYEATLTLVPEAPELWT
jgi:hypothetical protein